MLNEKVREVVTANGGEIVGEEYYPLDHSDYGETVDKIMSSGAEVVFNTIVPPGVAPFFQQLHDAGFTKRGGQIVCTYFDENFLNLVPAEQVEGLYSCLDYYQDVDDPFSKELLDRYNKLFPGSAQVHRRERVLRHVPGPEALGGRREGGGLARAGGRHRAPWTTRRSPRARAARRRWCPASTTCG